MDYGKLTVEEIKDGFCFSAEQEAYVCNYCGKKFSEGQVFAFGDSFHMPKQAASKHVEAEHGAGIDQLLAGGGKYNTLTETQKVLFSHFGLGLRDAEIANKIGIAASTVRHQKFTFREKAKRAKYYLAVYEAAFAAAPVPQAEHIIDIPNTATMLDDRYVMTEQEKQRIIDTEFSSLEPLRLKRYPAKAKKQVAVLGKIVEEFELGRIYTEEETREILSAIYEDYNLIRRYLVDYGFMGRTNDGSQYWLR